MRSTSRPRVLHVVGSGSVGGLARVVLDLIELQQDAFAFAVVTFGRSDFATALSSSGVPVYPDESVPASKTALLRGLFEALRSFKPDIVHSHMNITHMYCGLPALLRGCRLCLHHHAFQPDEWHQRRHRLVYRLLEKLGARVVAVSRQGASAFEAATGITGTSVVYNGIDTDRFRPRSHGDDAHASESTRSKTVISVGRLIAGKRFDILIDAARIVAAAEPDVLFMIVGDGEVREELEARITELSLADTVRLLGHRRDVADLLQQADAFAQSSESEGLPLSVIEAMACGLPVVASNVGGLAELVAHRESGLLVPAGRPDDLAEALLRVLRDRAVAARMGRNGLRRARELFDRRRMAEGIAVIYGSMLQR